MDVLKYKVDICKQVKVKIFISIVVTFKGQYL